MESRDVMDWEAVVVDLCAYEYYLQDLELIEIKDNSFYRRSLFEVLDVSPLKQCYAVYSCRSPASMKRIDA